MHSLGSIYSDTNLMCSIPVNYRADQVHPWKYCRVISDFCPVPAQRSRLKQWLLLFILIDFLDNVQYVQEGAKLQPKS
jgi:hypothetical protein